MSAQNESAAEGLQVFKNRAFATFARRHSITDVTLCKAVEEMRRGVVDADLGGGVIKQRLARPGSGKSGGYRSIIAFQAGRHTFSVYGFAKNERENIRDNELKELRRLAKHLLAASEKQIEATLDNGGLTEVHCNEDLQK